MGFFKKIVADSNLPVRNSLPPSVGGAGDSIGQRAIPTLRNRDIAADPTPKNAEIESSFPQPALQPTLHQESVPAQSHLPPLDNTVPVSIMPVRQDGPEKKNGGNSVVDGPRPHGSTEQVNELGRDERFAPAPEYNNNMLTQPVSPTANQSGRARKTARDRENSAANQRSTSKPGPLAANANPLKPSNTRYFNNTVTTSRSPVNNSVQEKMDPIPHPVKSATQQSSEHMATENNALVGNAQVTSGGSSGHAPVHRQSSAIEETGNEETPDKTNISHSTARNPHANATTGEAISHFVPNSTAVAPSPPAMTSIVRGDAQNAVSRAPQVRIGQVNVIVEAAAAPKPQTPSMQTEDLTSRLFLRSL